MTVTSVSPTPFALLRRTKNFQYGDSDPHLQELTAYDDPIKALTDECQRVLKCIANANQSNISSTKTSTSLRDAAWSRFEDVGFGASIDSESEDELGLGELGSLRPNPVNRPTTPSWAEYMSAGLTGPGSTSNGNGYSSPVFLPPLPAIPTSRDRHSLSATNGFARDRGSLSNISMLELDDTFWWTWITSLSGEETTARKAVFGRCAVVETVIDDAKWIVIEEQVKGAAPQETKPPTEDSTAKNNRGFFSSLGTRGGKMSRTMSTRISRTVR